MSPNRHWCHSARQIRPSTQHIWISDDCLDAAVQRFGRFAILRRGVGLVPGPLEARKRGTKRRLAFASLGNVGSLGEIESSLLNGANQETWVGKWSWQSPDLSNLLRSAPHSSWLSKMLRISNPSLRTSEGGTRNATILQTGQLRSRNEAFESERDSVVRSLSHCRGVNEMQALASQLGIDVRRHSGPLFRYLWKSTKSLEICLEFLANDRFDVSSAKNLQFLLDEVSQELRRDHDTEISHLKATIECIFTPWVRSHLSLGTRSLADIAALTQLIHEFLQIEGYEILGHRLAVAVVEGLGSSTVQNFEDLTLTTRRSLLSAIMAGKLSLGLQELGFRIAEIVKDEFLISRFLVKCIRYDCASRRSMGIEESERTVIPRINMLLEALPRRSATSTVRITSTLMVRWHASVLHDKVKATVCQAFLHLWWPFARKRVPLKSVRDWCEILEIEPVVPSERLPILATFAKRLYENENACFVFSSWFFSRLPPEIFEETYFDLKRNLRCESADPPFSNMIRIVHEKIGLDDGFMRHLFQLLARMRKDLIITDLISRSKSINVNVPQEAVVNVIRHLIPVSFRGAYEVFKSDPRISLENVPSLANRLIKDPRTHPNTVWHYRKKRKQQPVEDSPSAITEHLKAQNHLIDTIALSFSENRFLSLRMRQRNLAKCLICIRNEGLGPLSEAMLLALVRSTIIRPLQETREVADDAVTNLLVKVRQTAGYRVSDRMDRIVHAWRVDLEKQKPIGQSFESERHDFTFRRQWSKKSSQFNIHMLPKSSERVTQPREDLPLR